MKMRNTKGFTLVELMIVVAIIGILAAIAIPAFLRSVKKSKTSEAEGTMRKMADGSKSYFTSEQRYSTAMTGDQPWHGAGAVGSATAAGLPVPWSSYVFPGGTLTGANVFNTTTGPTAGACASAPTGGSKQLPHSTFNPAAPTPLSATLNKLGVSFTDPIYFQYQYATTGIGQTALATIGACAEFKVGGLQHTTTQTVSINPNSQEVQVGPASTVNEFE
jgi:prepilin-type N-terminal cleavage/methylation domain-containing protein